MVVVVYTKEEDPVHRVHWWSFVVHSCRASGALANRGVDRARTDPSPSNWVAAVVPSTVVPSTSRDAAVSKLAE